VSKGEGRARLARWGEKSCGPKTEKGEEKEFSFFSFSKQIFQKHFKFKFQFSLKFLINTKHSQNNMQQHVCITCS